MSLRLWLRENAPPWITALLYVKNTFVVCHWSNRWVGFCIPHLKMVPAQPNTRACAWKLSTDFSSLPKGSLRFHAGLGGWWNSHNSSHVVFPVVRVDSNICVLPVLVKYNDRSSSFCKAYYLSGSLGRRVGDIHWCGGVDLGWVVLWVSLSSPVVRCSIAMYMTQGAKLTWSKQLMLIGVAASL